MSNQASRSKSHEEPGSNGNEYVAPINFCGHQQQQDQIQQALRSIHGGQLNGAYSNQFRKDSAYTQAMNNPHLGQQHANINNLDESNPSLIYDRTIKVAKTDYADHGTHGVAGLPFAGGQPLSSVQMQLQMQQMLQQQQRSFQQRQEGLNTMMPPPNASLRQQHLPQAAYPSLVPGTLGSQQFFQNGDSAIAGTSSTQLIQASNVESASCGQPVSAAPAPLGSITGNQTDVGDQIENILVAAAGGVPITNLSTLQNVGLVNGVGANYNNNIEAPGDIRYGKKRISPSQPLHPSQLQLPHHGGSLLVSGAGGYALPNSHTEMNSVAEEEAPGVNSSIPDQTTDQNTYLYNTTINVLNNYIEQMGGVATAAAAVGQIPAQPQLPPTQQMGGVGIQGQQLGGDVSGFDLLAAAQVAQAAQALQSVERIGDALTNPSEPAANSGLDNAEGNLIVRRGDVFRIPRKTMHPHPPLCKSDKKLPSPKDEDPNEILEYTALSLLGQGTFAQVFHCIEKKTGKSVAVKIVKNKPAYTRQAAVEIDVFRKLNADDNDGDDNDSNGDDRASPKNSRAKSQSPSEHSCESSGPKAKADDSIIRLTYYFMHCSHLCLVFEMLGPNLYELLKKRQFRGLPIGAVRTLVRQAIEGIKLLGKKKVVHCDLKPENILIVRADAIDDIIAESVTEDSSSEESKQWIKLIDFGSACFEGQTAHTYIQSRFYRSPEVLVGLPYDSAIDMWSLGCVAAELFLGLPILPGVHEHDQLGRILEMIGDLPEWMLERGTKCSKFYKLVTKKRGTRSNPISLTDKSDGSPTRKTWEFKTRHEYISTLTEDEKQSKGGLAKLEQQPTNRYFKKKRLEDIVMHHGVCNTKKEKEQLGLFVHFLKGVLDPDPWKRWTAKQASMHPFLTGSNLYRNKLGEIGPDGTRSGTKPYDIHWVPPWDASICRRKLLVVQKTKEKSRRNSLQGRVQMQQPVPEGATAQAQVLPVQGIGMYGTPLTNVTLHDQSPAVSISSAQVTAMADAMSLNRLSNNGQSLSPPRNLEALLNAQLSNAYPYASNLSASLGANVGMGLPVNCQPLVDANLAGRSFSDHINASQLAAQQNIHALSGLNDLPFVPQPPQQPTFMGAQSFSGVYYDGMPSNYPHVEGDLGYALQRPGVFPISGNDAVAMLQRQASGQSLAYLAQQNAILSSSLSNITTPRGQVQSAGSLSFHTPGDLLQQLGLQDQGSFDNNYSQMNQGASTSLLAQQLADYSGPEYQQQNPNHQNWTRSNSSGIYGSMGPQMNGSYHGISGPMSLSSLPSFNQQQSASLGNYGGIVQDTHQQQIYLAQINSELANMQNQLSATNQNGQNETSNQDSRNRSIE